MILYVGLTPNWRLGFCSTVCDFRIYKIVRMLGYCVLLVVMGYCNIIFAFSGPFAKSVSKFFKSLQPSYREQQRKSREDKYKLNNEEASIVEQAVGAKLGARL